MKNILIIGATSAMAEATAKKYACDGCSMLLLARNTQRLNLITNDLNVRGAANVTSMVFDALADNDYEQLFADIKAAMPKIDICLVAHGSLPDQDECQQSIVKTMQEIQINGTSVIALLTPIANDMEAQKSGSIVVITSVAGIRGRQSNYVYGAAKSLVSAYLEGLGQRLAKSNVHVLDIKPGFVDSPMTADIENKGALWVQPEQVAEIIYTREAKKRHFSYAPSFWFVIMTIVRNIPTFIFNKLKL